jgi:cysteine desulfurase
MGVGSALAQGAIRASLGPTTRESEVDRFVEAWIRLSKTLLKEQPGIAA